MKGVFEMDLVHFGTNLCLREDSNPYLKNRNLTLYPVELRRQNVNSGCWPHLRVAKLTGNTN